MPVLMNKHLLAAGLQCPRRLWLEVNEPGLREEDSVSAYRLLEGRRVGEAARRRFPGGRLVPYGDGDLGRAAEETRELLDSGEAVLFEGAFLHAGVGIRTDVLQRTRGGEFDLIEVKSSTGLKEEHLHDVAVQTMVLRGANIAVRRAGVLHLNSDYVYEGGEHDYEGLFRHADVTEDALAMESALRSGARALFPVLALRKEPAVKVGPHCREPEICPYIEHCHGKGPRHPVSELNGARRAMLDSLRDKGIESVDKIPGDYPGLSALHRRILKCVATRKPFRDPAVAEELRRLRHPIHFLDFETIAPAIPVFPGTGPYETIPFQWSDHMVGARGALDHREYLATGEGDPRQEFVETLLDALGDSSGSIVIYSSYEATQLKSLAEAYPGHRKPLLAAVKRMVDLKAIVKRHVYHPDFHGSFSLKAVLPALVRGMGYDDLEIADGSAAQAAFDELMQPETAMSRRTAVRKDLLAYCGRDTEALQRVFEALARG